MVKFSVSERFACMAVGQHRSTQRKKPKGRADEETLTAAIIRLASHYGRYGYRRIAVMLRSGGWTVNTKRVERIWRCEGLKVPQKRPKKGWLWLNDGSCIRFRPEHRGHVWSYDFVADHIHDGKAFRMDGTRVLIGGGTVDYTGNIYPAPQPLSEADIAWWNGDCWRGAYGSEHDECYTHEPTHWMPLPPPPPASKPDQSSNLNTDERK
jgi:transposase InsO family protein